MSPLAVVALVLSVMAVITVVSSSVVSRALAATAATGTAGQFVPVEGRLLDTRPSTQVGPYSTPMPAGTWRSVQVESALGGQIPSSGVSAVLVAVTAVHEADIGHVDVSPNDVSRALQVMTFTTSTMSNAAIVPVSSAGLISAMANVSTDLVIDVEGYYTAGNGTAAAGGFVSVTPTTIADTTTGVGVPKAPVSPAGTLTVTAAGKAGIPASASAVFVNITVTRSSGSTSGFITPYPAGTSTPVSSMDYPSQSDPFAMGAQVALGTGGAFSIYVSNSNSVNLSVSVTGYFASGSSSGSFTPAYGRLYDSRVSPNSAVPANGTSVIPIAGVDGVPKAGSGISSVAIDVTTDGSGSGYLRVWGHGRTEPSTSSVNYDPSRYAVVSNLVTTSLGADGAIIVRNVSSTAMHVIIDLEGWYSNAAAAIQNGQSTTQQSVTLQAANTAGAWVTYQYRVGAAGSFANVPVANVKDSGGNSPSAWPVTFSGSGSSAAFTPYTWNIRDTLAGLSGNNGVAPDSLVQVQVCYGSSSTDTNLICGMPSDVDFSQSALGASATTSVGPGTVAELSGDFEVSATDADAASSLGGLSVGRTLTTLHPAAATTTADGVFGPGWSADLDDADAGSAQLTPVDDSGQGYILLTAPDGSETTYVADPTMSGQFDGADDDAGDPSIVNRVNSSTITLTDPDGTVTTWNLVSGAWQTVRVVQPGSNSTTTYSYNSAGLVTRIQAPAPAGVSCTAPDTTPGCRSLTLTYSSVSASGSSVTRLTEIDLSIPQTPGSANSVAVAKYDYDSSGRLADAWDPRISPALKTSYTYTSANRLATLTPPGEAAWSFGYDSTNRVTTVSRPDPSGSTATTTIVYGISPLTSGSNAGPVDLSPATDATWGETTDLPVTGTAVFNPDHVPGSTISSSDWPYASIDYLDVNGLTVNSASYGAGTWLVDTSQYDSNGNEIWSLTAGNRAQALSPTADTDPYVQSLSTGSTIDSVDAVAVLRTDTVYNPLSPGQVTDTYGPVHPVLLSTGATMDARTHESTLYDQGAPNSDVNPVDNQPYGLPTTDTTTAFNVATGTDSGWPDASVTVTGYNPVKSGDPSGWALGQATTSTVQMGASPSSADLTTSTSYDATGDVIAQQLPSTSSSSGPRTTDTVYYTATSTGSSEPAACVNPLSVGLVCQTSPASQPATGNPLPVTTYTYNAYGDQTAKTETYGTGSSQVVRTTSTGYDAGERKTSSSITVTPASAGGTAVPAVTYGYDPSTGLATTASTTTGPATTTLTTGYNNIGEATSYTDASGNTSTTSYDLDGRAVSEFDGKGTTTTSFASGASAYRNLPVSQNIGVSGAPSNFSAAYDAARNLVTETYPNGLVATNHYDNAGDLTSLVYAKSGSTWMTFTQQVNALGEIATQSSPQSSQNFGYDADDRLTTVQDTYSGACITRIYGFDNDSNRTSLNSYTGSGTGGATCSTSTTPTATSYSYDAADRLTSDTAGSYTQDVLGRATTIPAGDAQGIGVDASVTGNATVGYYANDMVNTEVQGSTTQVLTLDPLQDRINTSTNSAGTNINHYSNGAGDSPSWTSVSTTAWVRDCSGIDAGLAATVDQSGAVTLQLSDMHGDVVATSSDSPAATAVASYSESTEYGQARTPSKAYEPYGFGGAKQRSDDSLGGMVLMGVRIYNPASGRFQSMDPVAGGNANSYIYPDSPLSQSDDTGDWVEHCWGWFGFMCDDYFTRWETSAMGWLIKHPYIGGVAYTGLSTAVCASLTRSYKLGLVCAVAAAVGYSYISHKITTSANRHHCLEIRFAGPVPYHVEDNNGRYCR